MADDYSAGDKGEDNKTESRTDSLSDQEMETDLSLDTAFELLSDGRRRAVLDYLHDADDDAVALSELADYVATVETDSGVSDRERAEVSLHHHELPKLEETGVIDYDPRSRTIRYWGNSLLEDLLTIAVREDPK